MACRFVSLYVVVLYLNRALCSLSFFFVAGVMATWCFDKSHADNCCSWAIVGSLLVRSLTFFVCLGSLVQGFVIIFRFFIVESAQRQRQEYQMENGWCWCWLLVGVAVVGVCVYV
jgi:uncharacterized membrane protein YidH (DUF202 family)